MIANYIKLNTIHDFVVFLMRHKDVKHIYLIKAGTEEAAEGESVGG